jgi:hypothetical protein
VPRISRFYGVDILMYYGEHGVAHFHAQYAEFEASIAIEGQVILGGQLPGRALAFVREWAQLHRDDLLDDWRRARASQPLRPIEPLN